MNLDGVQAITFDAGGTLIVPHPSVGEVYAEVLAGLGHQVSPDAIERNFRAAFKALKANDPDAVLDRAAWRQIVAGTLDGLTPAESFEAQFDALWNAFASADRWRTLPGIEAALSDLQSRGFRLFVLSNNDSRLRDVLDGLGLSAFFEAIFISSELGAEKPSPKIFINAQTQIQVPPAAILHVGDSPAEDVTGALNAGWRAALVGTKAASPHHPASVTCADSVGSLFG